MTSSNRMTELLTQCAERLACPKDSTVPEVVANCDIHLLAITGSPFEWWLTGYNYEVYFYFCSLQYSITVTSTTMFMTVPCALDVMWQSPEGCTWEVCSVFTATARSATIYLLFLFVIVVCLWVYDMWIVLAAFLAYFKTIFNS